MLTAFFLEASFLGIMFFGKGKVSNRTHFIATRLVAMGTTLSAFWVLSLNSWILTPDGFEIRGGIFLEFKGVHPPVVQVFIAIRLRLAVGALMILVFWWAC